jgi:hypothetical protein
MDRPILFSTPLVRPTIDGYKTVTRRLRDLKVINENPGEWVYIGGAANMGRDLEIIDGKQEANFYNTSTGAEERILCPYGAPGDTLWVRETFVPLTNGYGYKADGLIRCGKIPGTNSYYQPRMRWVPSIHMPRKASRIDLELLKIGVERAHDITEEQAKMEGVERGFLRDGPNTEKGEFQLELTCKGNPIGVYRDGFIYTWMTLNGRESWEKNPWVWRLHFKLLKCTTP